MAEYIDREKVLETFGLWFSRIGTKPSFEDVQTIIQQVPAADVEPVRHGQWILLEGPDGDNNVTTLCSCCSHGDTHAVGTKVPFCWFCGVKMDGEVTQDG